MTELISIASTEGFSIDADASVSDAMACMLSNGNGVVVLLEKRKPVGIVTESLLLAHIEKMDFNAPVIIFSKKPVITAHQTRPVESAFDIVVTNNIRRLVLVDDEGNYCGVVLQDTLFNFLEEDVYKIDLRVADLIRSDSKVITIDQSASLYDAILLMKQKKIGSVIVTNSQYQGIGILTEKDILSAGYRHIDLVAPVTQMMSSPVLSIDEQSAITDVIDLMRQKHVRRLLVVDAQGEMRTLLTNRDIFQHIKGNVARMLEIKLRHAKEIMDLLPEAIIEIFDTPSHQVIHWMNRHAHMLFGEKCIDMHPSKLIGKEAWKLLYTELQEKEILESALIDIGEKSFEFSGTLSQNIHNRYIKLIAKDVSKHEATKKMLQAEIDDEIQLRRENEYLMMQQARMASMGETVGYIAHQWRQPLAQLGGVLMNLESAYSFGELEEVYMQKKIAQGNEMIKYMSQTIDDFRSFFLPDQKQETFDIVSSIEQSIQIVSASLNYCHIDIKTEMKRGLFFVKGYPNEFAQAILNLINNARDALSKVSSNKKYISIVLKKENEMISILICDNGGGIDPKLLPDIFEPYVTGKQESGGTGVGLYITRLIIEQKMQGKIEAYNTEEGACFEIKF